MRLACKRQASGETCRSRTLQQLAKREDFGAAKLTPSQHLKARAQIELQWIAAAEKMNSPDAVSPQIGKTAFKQSPAGSHATKLVVNVHVQMSWIKARDVLLNFP